MKVAIRFLLYFNFFSSLKSEKLFFFADTPKETLVVRETYFSEIVCLLGNEFAARSGVVDGSEYSPRQS